MTGLTLRCMRISRKTSANTHFEEWWFKTFYNNYGIRGFLYYTYFYSTLANMVKVLFLCLKNVSKYHIRICPTAPAISSFLIILFLNPSKRTCSSTVLNPSFKKCIQPSHILYNSLPICPYME